ncbi:hypothetical protein [Pseudoteredinibacter isoporae]|uniref:hypothetical protein n=1 Tax=Pseudoteredinibacter isoporae TaxID=570281 RepID=UPI003109253C
MKNLDVGKIIAKRDLLFSFKESKNKNKLTVVISEPRMIESDEFDFDVDPGASACTVKILGLPDEFVEEVHGADSIQALSFAIDIDGYLRRLQKDYDIYWADGEPYFDD